MSSQIRDNYNADVDLKWSLWSCNKGYWDEYAPGVWEWMQEWFDASTDSGNPTRKLRDSPRVVHLAPRKEIQFGDVEIVPGGANVHFWTEYDEDCKEEPPHIFDKVEAETFEELMHLIDHRNLDLLNEMRDKRYKPELCLGILGKPCGYPESD